MTRVTILLLLLVIPLKRLLGQCALLEFAVANENYLCKNTPLQITNATASGSSFYWDFCPETFLEVPLNESANLQGFGNGYGYKLLEDNGSWYGFLVSRSLDKLFRLDFGQDPRGSPILVDLGNPDGLMDAPEGIEIYKDGNNWVAFVGKGENSTGQVVKFEFGSDLTNVPAATGFGTFGLGPVRVRDLSIVRQGDDIILLLLIYNTSSINRINFGTSLNNTPSANNIVAIPGATLPRGFTIVTSCDTWRAHVVSENGLVQQLSFGNDILGQATVDGSFTFPSVVQPWKIKSLYNGGKYYSIISNASRKYTIIDFDDLSLLRLPVEVVQNNDIRLIGFDVAKHHGISFIQGAGASNLLFSVAYEKTCGLLQDYSYERTPPLFQYATAGSFVIDLFSSIDHKQLQATSEVIEIRPLEAPEVKITHEGACTGSEVLFSSNNNEPLASWSWDFDNGTTSSSSSPVTIYASAGVYTVSLVAQATSTCVTTSTSDIKVYDPPTSSFLSPSTLLCTNNQYLFPTTTPDIYEGNMSYQWFMDDSPVSSDRDLQYTFTTSGSKEIRLVTSIPGCADEMTVITPSIEVGPVVDFSFTGTCEDDNFSFRHQVTDPVENYSWNFGADSSADENPSWRFSTSGDYTVSLTATNAVGCENTKTKSITVHSKPLVDFNASGPPNICSGYPTVFQNQTTNPDGRNISGWLWHFGDFNDANPKGDKDPEHVFQTPATYSVTLTATTAAGCTSSVQKDILILESPSTALTHSSTCDDVPVLFTGPPDANITHTYWEIGTSYYEVSSPTHTFRSPGNYRLYLEVTAANGCIATANKTLRVPDRVSPDFSVSRNCLNQEALFTDITTGADPVVSAGWTVNGDDTFTGATFRYTFTDQVNQNITLKVTTEAGCAYDVTRQVPVYLPPIASFSADRLAGAYPLEVEFINTSTGAREFNWQFMYGTGATSTVESPVHTFVREGVFQVALTALDEHQCEDVFAGTITTIAPMPDGDIEMIALAENPDGSTKLIVTIQNNGNTILQDIPLDVDFSGNLSLRHMLEEPVLPGSKYNVVFSTGIVSMQTLPYLCVNLSVDNDFSPAGNRMCRKFKTDLVVFSSYPNPAASTLHMEWISDAAGTVGFSLTDAVGRLIFRRQATASIGLNHQTIDLDGVVNGLYYLHIVEGGKRTRQRIVVCH